MDIPANDCTETQQEDTGSAAFSAPSRIPGLLAAHVPADGAAADRILLTGRIVCGRREDCEFSLFDAKVSSRHFSIRLRDGVPVLEDLGSTNGTFVDGMPVTGPLTLTSPAVIRCGESVLVFHPDAVSLLRPPPPRRYGMAGRFHLSEILSALKEAAVSEHPLLIAGPSGTGKELAARAYAEMISEETGRGRLSIYNAAKFASREEAASALFGVSARVFSNVDARAGLIEQADGGTLFLDELHNLPMEMQRSLLRVLEDGAVTRLGETSPRRVRVRFAVASNAEGETRGLAPDLFARLRLLSLPGLSERIADVPSIFVSLLTERLRAAGESPGAVLPLLRGDHFESLCLADFSGGNVRILRDLADRVVTRMRVREDAAAAVADVFGERFKDGPVVRRAARREKGGSASRYQRHKALIVETYWRCNENVAATERALKKEGISCSRRWLSVFLEDWGVKSR